MRTWWLTLRITLLFAAVMGLVLTGTLFLFIRVFGLHAGHGPGRAVHDLVRVAEQVEQLLANGDGSFDSPQLQQLLELRTAELGLGLRLVDRAGVPVVCGNRHLAAGIGLAHQMRVRGRLCKWFGPPAVEISIPIGRQGQRLGALVGTLPINTAAAHAAFQSGLLYVGGVTLIAVVALSLYLTRPLRRMSRSMDLIAAGDLRHRVSIQGHGEVAQMGRSFNTMADRIERMVVGQKELLAGVSHELRSPLARMKVALELLRGEQVSPQRLADLEAEVDTVDGLVAEVLEASRLDLGATPLQAEVLDLPRLAAVAWQRVEQVTSLSLELQVAADAAQIMADRQLVVRTLGNLFENAARYAGSGSVQVRSERRGDRVRITVSDQGSGVAEEHLPRLFEPFFRSDPSRSRRTGATGLGLMIVRRAVEAHGGTVRAGRADSGGLAVSFDLPAA